MRLARFIILSECRCSDETIIMRRVFWGVFTLNLCFRLTWVAILSNFSKCILFFHINADLSFLDCGWMIDLGKLLFLYFLILLLLHGYYVILFYFICSFLYLFLRIAFVQFNTIRRFTLWVGCLLKFSFLLRGSTELRWVFVLHTKSKDWARTLFSRLKIEISLLICFNWSDFILYSLPLMLLLIWIIWSIW